MIESVQRGALGGGQESAERLLRREGRAQRQNVHEETDQTFQLRLLAPGNVGTDQHVIAAAEAMQQDLERGQHRAVQRDTGTRRHRLKPFMQGHGQRETEVATFMGRRLGARLVGGQLQHAAVTGQCLFPVTRLRGQHAGALQLLLPEGVIGVLDRQRWQRLNDTRLRPAVEAHQFIDQHRHRPAIGDDVVHRIQQHMFGGAQLEHLST